MPTNFITEPEKAILRQKLKRLMLFSKPDSDFRQGFLRTADLGDLAANTNSATDPVSYHFSLFPKLFEEAIDGKEPMLRLIRLLNLVVSEGGPGETTKEDIDFFSKIVQKYQTWTQSAGANQAVEQGAGDATEICLDLGRRAATRPARVGAIAAGRRLHVKHHRESLLSGPFHK